MLGAKGVAWTVPSGDHRGISKVIGMANKIFSKQPPTYRTMVAYAAFCEHQLAPIGVKLRIVNMVN